MLVTIIEIMALIVATSAIAILARGRGGSPALTGAVAVCGYFFFWFLTTFVLTQFGFPEAASWIGLFAGWVWMGAVALYARFWLGASKVKPGGMWVCANCKMLNQHYAVICDACQQPYEATLKQKASKAAGPQ